MARNYCDSATSIFWFYGGLEKKNDLFAGSCSPAIVSEIKREGEGRGMVATMTSGLKKISVRGGECYLIATWLQKHMSTRMYLIFTMN